MVRREHPVQNHFKYDSGKDQSFCNYCNQGKKGKHSSNLLRHLISKHKEVYDVMTPQLLAYKAQEETHNDQRITVSYSLEELKKSFACMVSVDGRPFKIVEDIGMKKIIKPIHDACEKSGIPFKVNRKNVAEFCSEYETKMIEQIKTELRNKLVSVEMDMVKIQER